MGVVKGGCCSPRVFLISGRTPSLPVSQSCLTHFYEENKQKSSSDQESFNWKILLSRPLAVLSGTAQLLLVVLSCLVLWSNNFQV